MHCDHTCTVRWNAKQEVAASWNEMLPLTKCSHQLRGLGHEMWICPLRSIHSRKQNALNTDYRQHSRLTGCYVMVPCHRGRRWRPFDARAICPLQPWWSVSVGLTLSSQHVDKLPRNFSLWRPLALLPSTLPVTVKCSRLCFLITWPKN